MSIISRIREWIRGMLSKSDVSSVYGVELAITDDMLNAIEDWERMYAGKAFWINHEKGIYSLRLEQAIVRELSNISTNEMTVKISNKKLDTIFRSSVKNLNLNLQRWLASGAMINRSAKIKFSLFLNRSLFLLNTM